MTIICGDCLEEMKKMESNSISAIVTDPPYGLSFMNKKWDHAVPGKEYWSECLRISKPGSYLLAMGGTRTFHRLATVIEDAGYEIRDIIMWIYGSGFPKSHNHFGIEGYGTALKPAYEPIIMAMKPCEGTFKQNAEKWGQAGINIDGCRITSKEKWEQKCHDIRSNGLMDKKGRLDRISQSSELGRWPANILFDEEAANMLDEQTGNLSKSSIRKWNNSYISNQVLENGLKPIEISGGINDSGGASRFFYCAKASSNERNEGLKGLPLGAPVATGRSKPDIGRKDPSSYLRANHHPTVKPLKLMEYLIKLIMPPQDGILLDPFAGSGTTILAAKNLGYNAIGIEKTPEYCKIAIGRINNEKQMSLLNACI